jgi:hypothetical protein
MVSVSGSAELYGLTGWQNLFGLCKSQPSIATPIESSVSFAFGAGRKTCPDAAVAQSRADMVNPVLAVTTEVKSGSLTGADAGSNPARRFGRRQFLLCGSLGRGFHTEEFGGRVFNHCEGSGSHSSCFPCFSSRVGGRLKFDSRRVLPKRGFSPLPQVFLWFTAGGEPFSYERNQYLRRVTET